MTILEMYMEEWRETSWENAISWKPKEKIAPIYWALVAQTLFHLILTKYPRGRHYYLHFIHEKTDDKLRVYGAWGQLAQILNKMQCSCEWGAMENNQAPVKVAT